MGKKGRPAKGEKGMKMSKMGRSAKRALLGMSKKEREMVVAGLSNGNTSKVCVSLLLTMKASYTLSIIMFTVERQKAS